MVVIQRGILRQADGLARIFHELLAEGLALFVQQRSITFSNQRLDADLNSLRQRMGRFQHDDSPFDVSAIDHLIVLHDKPSLFATVDRSITTYAILPRCRRLRQP